MAATTEKQTTGVLLMAYGAAQSLEEIGPYLLDIRGGRPVSQELIDEVQERYRAMGGKSPLLSITKDQALALQKKLPQAKVFIGMRHWHPYIKDTVAQMAQEGFKKITALCLTPYYSKLSVEAYRSKLNEAINNLKPRPQIRLIERWHTQPLLIEAFAEKLRAALMKFPSKNKSEVAVIFSAHSLPQKILEWKDPYPGELLETARLVAQHAGVPPGRWYFAYQSQGRTPEPWLGPDVREMLEQLAQRGVKNIIVDPIGFISDHMETLYDDDILYKKIAESLGIKFVRAESLNTSPTFIGALAAAIKQKPA